jgi:predicted metalloprotease with PDZ domain
VVSASPETALNRFDLTDHPARSAFALGPYRVHDIDENAGVRAAIHGGWDLARSSLVNYSQHLVRAQSRQFGPPPGDPTLMVFTPLPERVRPTEGVRTAGMVWDRTLVLFGGASPSVPRDATPVRELVAVFVGHELFHLYVPWGLPITQPLSWLSEGWAEHVGRSSAVAAGLITRGAADNSLREAYYRYIDMGGRQAGSLQNAAESGEQLRELLYMRGELVFRVLELEWAASGKPGSFDAVLWQRLQLEYDGESPLEPDAVSRVLNAMVSPTTVRRLVDGAEAITLPELGLGRR